MTTSLRNRIRRSQAARDALVEQYLPLVRHVAARLRVTMPAMLDRDDFRSAGVVGLIHAAETWDPDRGASFKTFAFTAIRGAILDEIRKHDPVPRGRRDRLRRTEAAATELACELGRAPMLEEIAERIGATVEDLDDDLLALHTARALSLDDLPGDGPLGPALADPHGTDPVSRATIQDALDRVTVAVAELPNPDRQVVVLYHHEGLYLKEIGALLGVTESRVSQILSRAIARLRLALDESLGG